MFMYIFIAKQMYEVSTVDVKKIVLTAQYVATSHLVY